MVVEDGRGAWLPLNKLWRWLEAVAHHRDFSNQGHQLVVDCFGLLLYRLWGVCVCVCVSVRVSYHFTASLSDSYLHTTTGTLPSILNFAASAKSSSEIELGTTSNLG